jgi:hypothetical protein
LLGERKIKNSLVSGGIMNPMSLGPLAKKRKEIFTIKWEFVMVRRLKNL